MNREMAVDAGASAGSQGRLRVLSGGAEVLAAQAVGTERAAVLVVTEAE